MITMFRGPARAGPLLGILVALLAILRPAAASAHAELAQSDPPAQSILAQAPAQVVLFFTENIEPRSFVVRVLDGARRPVDRGDAAFLPGTTDAIAVSLGDLAPGVYTIAWQVTSTDDGHTTKGLTPFSIGDAGAAPDPLAGAQIGAATSGGVGLQSGPVGAAARWLVLLGSLALIGLFAAMPLFAAPVARCLAAMRDGRTEAAVTAPAADEVIGRTVVRLVRLAWLSLGVFVLGSLLLLLVDAAAAADTSLFSAIGAPLGQFFASRRGTLWLVRAGIALVVAGAIFAASRGRWGVARPGRWWLAAAAASAMLLATSLNSHSAALERGATLATALDWVHFAAAGMWIGGLLFLLLALLPSFAPLGGPARTTVLADLLPRFSRVALISVAVVVVTGIVQSWQLLDGLGALRDLAWGRALVLKVALVVLLLGLGALNLLVIRPRLTAYARRMDRPTRERAASLRRTFRRVVLAEVALGVLIALVAGVLTGVSPSRAAVDTPAGPFRPLVLEAAGEDLGGRLVLSPGRVGVNRFDLVVRSADGGALPGDTTAVLRFRTLDQDTGIAEARLKSLGAGRFTTSGAYLSTVGLWEVAAIVRRPGRDDVSMSFLLPLGETTGQP